MSNILVTGGAGFVGTNLVRQLLSLGHTVHSVDDYSAGKKQNHIEGAIYHHSCTSEINNIQFQIDFDYVYHLAEYSRITPSFEFIEQVWKSNCLGTFQVLEFCRNNKVKKIVYAGSSTKFAPEGVGHSPYSFTKSQSVELLKNYHKWYELEYSICYFYNVFGPHYDSSPVVGYESVVSVFEKQYKSQKPLTIFGDGEQKRSFTFVGDIVDGLMKSCYYENSEEFQLNNRTKYTINQIAKMFKDDIIYLPSRKGDRRDSSSIDNKSRELLNWSTTVDVSQWIKEIKNVN